MVVPILGEVFGFKPEDLSREADRHRENRLCPYGNNVPQCTKDKVADPLGVCSVKDGDRLAITCPVRFREKSIAITDAARFFFPDDAAWKALPEIRLTDESGRPAGNIDYVLVSYDKVGRVIDFGTLEVQAVYISGNIRRPFEIYMEGMAAHGDPDRIDLDGIPHRPHPDYLSSSRKRLAPQLMFKGGIVGSWGKKQAVAVNKGFWETLPALTECSEDDADLVWLVYDLVDAPTGRHALVKCDVAYTRYHEAMRQVTEPSPGVVDGFLESVQRRLDDQLAQDV